MELKILHWFEELHNPVLDFLMYQITCLGNGGLIWLVIAAAMLFVLPKRYRKTGATVVAALLISLVICNGIMKNLYQRVRPFHADPTFENLYRVFDRIYDWSFPSGHTSASFAAAVAILIANRARVRAYIQSEWIDRRCLKCFFLSAGVIVLTVLMVINMVIALSG